VEPTSRIDLDFLMTLYVPLEPAQRVNGLSIYACKPGGWVAGPGIRGEVVPPTADWLRTGPDGVSALDVRLSILADDGSYIFMQYHGRIVGADRLQHWPRPNAAPNYFFINPVFETASAKYGWLNDVVCVGKDIAPPGTEDYARYEIFVAR
jgi:hypothetical protein